MKRSRSLQAACAAVFVFSIVGCHNDMWLQPKVMAQDKSEFYADNMASRMPVRGTVQYLKPRTDDIYYGYIDGKLVEEFPIVITEEVIRRGQERFNIFCLNCHGALGDGTGMIAQRGFNLQRPVATYHTDRLREMPVGHFFDVITNGYGTMYSLAARITPEDRWAVVAYVRVLQRSQNATIDDVPVEQRDLMDTPELQLDDERRESEGGGH